MDCIRDPCPYCSWTNYTVYPCSATCNTGFQLQTRQCLTTGGQLCGTCDGSDVISTACTQLPACPGWYQPLFSDKTKFFSRDRFLSSQ